MFEACMIICTSDKYISGISRYLDLMPMELQLRAEHEGTEVRGNQLTKLCADSADPECSPLIVLPTDHASN